jgi:hypothetical protein
MSQQTPTQQRTWYSERHGLTLQNLMESIRNKKSINPVDTGVILSELYLNGDSAGLMDLREAVTDMEGDGLPEVDSKTVADCKLFWLSQIANGYLTEINNISCRYIRYDAFSAGEVTDFYKRATGFDPVRALPLADRVFRGELHPSSKAKLEVR